MLFIGDKEITTAISQYLASWDALGISTDPAVEGSNTIVDGGEVGGTTNNTPGGQTVNGAANTEGATRVTLYKKNP